MWIFFLPWYYYSCRNNYYLCNPLYTLHKALYLVTCWLLTVFALHNGRLILFSVKHTWTNLALAPVKPGNIVDCRTTTIFPHSYETTSLWLSWEIFALDLFSFHRACFYTQIKQPHVGKFQKVIHWWLRWYTTECIQYESIIDDLNDTQPKMNSVCKHVIILFTL